MADIVTADPSILLAGQTPDLLGNFQQGMKMSALATQNKQVKQQWQDDQTMRDAFKNNMQTGPDGTQQLNQAGVLSDLNNAGLGEKANTLKGQWLTQGFQQQSAMIDNKIKKLDAFGQIIGAVKDQPSYNEARTNLINLGLAKPEEIPTQYDKGFVDAHVMGAMTAKDQLAAKNEQLTTAIKQQDADNKKQELSLQTAKMGKETAQFLYTKQFEANQQVGQSLEAARQSPDAAQALKNRQSAQNLNELIKQAPGGDPNNLTPPQVKLISMEAAKMGIGGIPGEAEMEKMDPGTAMQYAATALSKVTNRRVAANAGDFVKQFQDYANGISQTGGQLLLDRSNRIADQRRSDLGENNYQNYKNGFNKEFADVISNNKTKAYADKHGLSIDDAKKINSWRTGGE